MSNDAKQNLINYLSEHPYLNLGTVSSDGKPIVSTVGYVSEGATVYFVTDRKTRKAANIESNPSVAYTVDEDEKDLKRIRGIQVKGRASLVSDSAEVQKIMELMNEKFPYIKELPENPDYVFIKVEPVEADFIDNTKGFGHRDKIRF